MKTYGLIGYPLSHSFSPGYFKEKFQKENISNCEYLPFPLKSIADFTKLLNKTHNLCGLNVTIPYKETIIPYLDFLDKTAESIGAVNTIQFKNGKLIGHNTDVSGFKNSYLPFHKEEVKKALILGTGGASKAVIYALNELGVTCQYVSRSNKKEHLLYDQLDKSIFDEHLLIVNTTPLGMYPKTEDFPTIPFEFLSDKHILYDLVYNPQTTTFMKKGISKGAVVKNGLEMLHLQAEASWKVWNT